MQNPDSELFPCVATQFSTLIFACLTVECPQWESNPMMTDRGPFVLSCVPCIESERVSPSIKWWQLNHFFSPLSSRSSKFLLFFLHSLEALSFWKPSSWVVLWALSHKIISHWFKEEARKGLFIPWVNSHRAESAWGPNCLVTGKGWSQLSCLPLSVSPAQAPSEAGPPDSILSSCTQNP